MYIFQPVVRIVTRLRARRPEFDSGQGWEGMFIFTTASRLALGPTRPLIKCALGGLFPGGKAAVAWSWNSPPFSAEVTTAWSYTCIPPYVFMAWYLVKYRDNFTFT